MRKIWSYIRWNWPIVFWAFLSGIAPVVAIAYLAVSLGTHSWIVIASILAGVVSGVLNINMSRLLKAEPQMTSHWVPVYLIAAIVVVFVTVDLAYFLIIAGNSFPLATYVLFALELAILVFGVPSLQFVIVKLLDRFFP